MEIVLCFIIYLLYKRNTSVTYRVELQFCNYQVHYGNSKIAIQLNSRRLSWFILEVLAVFSVNCMIYLEGHTPLRPNNRNRLFTMPA